MKPQIKRRPINPATSGLVQWFVYLDRETAGFITWAEAFAYALRYQSKGIGN